MQPNSDGETASTSNEPHTPIVHDPENQEQNQQEPNNSTRPLNQHDETPTPIEPEIPKTQQPEQKQQQQYKTTNPTNQETGIQTIIPQTPRQELQEGEISDSEAFMSPAVVPKIPFSANNIVSDEKINRAAKLCMQLHKDNFCDLGRMDKISARKSEKLWEKQCCWN